MHRAGPGAQVTAATGRHRAAHRFRHGGLAGAAMAWLVLAAGVLPLSARAQQATEVAEAPPAVAGPVLIPADRHPDYPCMRSLLQQLLDSAGPRGRSTFHISPVQAGDHDFVRVYWPRDASITIVQLDREGCADPARERDRLELAWYRGKAHIDLRHDVVADEAAVAGSSYLVARPWVEQVIDECRRRGTALSLTRRARGPAAAAE